MTASKNKALTPREHHTAAYERGFVGDEVDETPNVEYTVAGQVGSTSKADAKPLKAPPEVVKDAKPEPEETKP